MKMAHTYDSPKLLEGIASKIRKFVTPSFFFFLKQFWNLENRQMLGEIYSTLAVSIQKVYFRN